MSDTQRSVVWKCLFADALELFELREVTHGWELSGTVVGVAEDLPLRVVYTISCGPDWRTREVSVAVTHGSIQRTLSVPASHIADDIDLGITPATNTLPIRRLNLSRGSAADVEATWITFPTLAIQPLSQRYTRIAKNRYRYESDTGFTCELEVDDDGLVTHYPGGWQMIAES